MDGFKYILFTFMSWSLSLGTSGCTGPSQSQNLKLPYRQSMLGTSLDRSNYAPPGKRKHEAKPRSEISSIKTATEPLDNTTRVTLGRCRSLVGKSYGDAHDIAMRQMIEACLGPQAWHRVSQGIKCRLSRKQPKVLSLVYFHNTFDRNQNGLLDDRFTDIGIVLNVVNQKIEFLSVRRYGVEFQAELGVLNVAQPHHRRLVKNSVENSYLRMISPTDLPGTSYLAGQLLAGFLDFPS